MTDEIRDLLDLERYPLDQPASSTYRELVVDCQQAIAAEGLFSLAEFMREAAVESAVEQLVELRQAGEPRRSPGQAESRIGAPCVDHTVERIADDPDELDLAQTLAVVLTAPVGGDVVPFGRRGRDVNSGWNWTPRWKRFCGNSRICMIG